MRLPFEDFMDFAKSYVEEAGSSIEDVEITRALSPQELVDLTGHTCLRTDKSKYGYEIFEYESPEGVKLLMILDIMAGRWIKVE